MQHLLIAFFLILLYPDGKDNRSFWEKAGSLYHLWDAEHVELECPGFAGFVLTNRGFFTTIYAVTHMTDG